MESEAVVEFGRGQEDSFWVGVEREGLGRGDEACFAQFGRFAEVWIFFSEKGRDSQELVCVCVCCGWGCGGEGRGGWRLGVKGRRTDYDPAFLWACDLLFYLNPFPHTHAQ